MNSIEHIKNIENIFYDSQHLKELIKSWTKENVHVLTDFDKTITSGDSETTWSLFIHGGFMPQGYIREMQILFEKYHPFQIDSSISEEYRREYMYKWWTQHLSLLKKYELSEKTVKAVATNSSLMSFREGAREFLNNCKSKNIPVVIISGGIGNFIEEFLRHHNFFNDNILLVSNFIKFKRGIADGFTEKTIHVANKDEHELPNSVREIIKNRTNTLLMGDSIDDIKMVANENRKNSLKIGFLEEEIDKNLPYFKQKFDVVCKNNCSLDFVNKLIDKYIK